MNSKQIIWPLFFLVLGVFLGAVFFSSKGAAPDHQMVQNNTFWTCSMHPEIKEDGPSKCPICAMDLVSSSPTSNLEPNQIEISEEALAMSNISTVKVAPQNTKGTALTLSGVIKTNAETDAVQTILFDGRLDKLLTNTVGDKITKGQRIGRVYTPELYLGQDRLFSSLNIRETHPALFASARYSMGLWKLTDAQIDSMLKKGKPLFNFDLYADVSGTVTEVNALVGDYVSQGDVLYKVSDLSKVWAVFDAYEHQLPLLQQGSAITITIPGIHEKVEAKIALIEPLFEKDQRLVSVRAVLNNPHKNLLPGMFVEGQIESFSGQEGIFVPKTAVLWTGKRSIVYRRVYAGQPVFELVEIELGNVIGDTYHVKSGLSAGDDIVVEGAFTLDAAAQLQGKKSMLNSGSKENSGLSIPSLIDGQGKIDISNASQKSLQSILEAYLQLKNALVLTDLQRSKRAIERLDVQWRALLDTKGLQFSNDTIANAVNQLRKARGMDEIRMQFKALSSGVYELLKNHYFSDGKVYVQFCPMADENRGATWLSLEREIQNPYYGNQMLNCGKVQEIIQP